MTTDNPEVQAILITFTDRKGETVLSRGVRLIENHDPSCVNALWNYDPLIRLSDYQKLQAEYEKLISYTQNGIECFANPCPSHSGVNTPPFTEFQERYGGLCLMCVVNELEALKAECKKLQKDVERQTLNQKSEKY